MNLIASLIIFDILIIVYQILIEVFTILYRINGVNIEVSRFQVISLLTGTGFTTDESESMILTKSRRKITRRIMFFSYIFNISIVSTFVSIFSSTMDTKKEEVPIYIGLTLFIIIFLIIFYKTKIRKNVIDKIVMNIVDRKKKKTKNPLFIYDTFGKKVIAEIEIKNLNEKLSKKTIEEIGLNQKYNISLLVIKRKEAIISEITPDTIIKPGDTIVVFGKLKDIKKTFVNDLIKQK